MHCSQTCHLSQEITLTTKSLSVRQRYRCMSPHCHCTNLDRCIFTCRDQDTEDWMKYDPRDCVPVSSQAVLLWWTRNPFWWISFVFAWCARSDFFFSLCKPSFQLNNLDTAVSSSKFIAQKNCKKVVITQNFSEKHQFNWLALTDNNLSLHYLLLWRSDWVCNTLYKLDEIF